MDAMVQADTDPSMAPDSGVRPEGLVGAPADRLAAARAVMAGTPAGGVLDAIAGVLDQVPATTQQWGLHDPAVGRAVLAGLYAAEQRLRGLVDTAIAAAEQYRWTDEVGLAMAGWLHQFNAENRPVCVRRVARARQVAAQPRLSQAMTAGLMAPDQAVAVASVLADLPETVGPTQHGEAAETMVQLAAEHDPKSLAGLSGYLLEVVAPDRAEQLQAEQLMAQEAKAARQRELYFTDDGHGSVLIRGKLPALEAARLRSVVDALAHRRRRCLAQAAGTTSLLPGVVDEAAQSWLDASQAPDAGAMPMTTLARCRADALVELAHIAAATGDLPAHGGDRPRLAVTIDHNTLRQPTGMAHLVDGTAVSWAKARQIACDAAVLPIVLDTAGVPLDIGHEQRFFTGTVRLAVQQRDGGCVFPGCDRTPAGCDIHHVVPWWNGGPTTLTNGLALCPHHHGLVEPRPGADQWHITWTEEHLPAFTPPTTLDPQQRPQLHTRFRTRHHHKHSGRNAGDGQDGDEPS